MATMTQQSREMLPVLPVLARYPERKTNLIKKDKPEKKMTNNTLSSENYSRSSMPPSPLFFTHAGLLWNHRLAKARYCCARRCRGANIRDPGGGARHGQRIAGPLLCHPWHTSVDELVGLVETIGDTRHFIDHLDHLIVDRQTLFEAPRWRTGSKAARFNHHCASSASLANVGSFRS